MLTTFHNASKVAKKSGGLPFNEFRILFELREHPDGMRVGELADVLHLKSNDLAVAADDLCNLGLIKRSKDHIDRRATILEVTNDGAEAAEKIAAAVGLTYAESGPPMSRAHNEKLLEFARLVLEGMGEKRF